jgi:membrane-bound ClpP family serine protease
MKVWSILLIILGVILVVAGALGALYGVAVLVVQIANSMQARTWLPAANLPIALIATGAGAAAMGLGTYLVLRQNAARRARKQQEQDRLRRVRDYIRDTNSSFDTFDSRREPYIGREANRRVA